METYNIQVIDTTHDYMRLIYEFVIKKDNNEDIYEKIRYDFDAFIKTDTYKEHDKLFINNHIYWWMSDYAFNLSQDSKNKLFNIYGHARLFKELVNIAYINDYHNVDDFIDNNANYENIIIVHIIENDIINLLLPPEYYI